MLNEIENNDNDIAIISMACRYPDANNVNEFWANLSKGHNSVKILDAQELKRRGLGDLLKEKPNLICAQSSLGREEIKLFDAKFFNVSPREAETMDPQQRLFLEACWEVFESAGYSTEHYNGKVGVFASTAGSEYLSNNLSSNIESLKDFGAFQVSLGNQKDFLATKVSYKMGFTGPSINVNTLCSSSALAIHLARESLLNYQIDFAITGAVNISIDSIDSLYYQEGGIEADEGCCRAYDERASGTVGGSGLGVIAMKRLVDALDDGDTILAVIKGTAVNNDGATKASYTAPSPDGQAEVIAEALAVSGVEPDTIGYIDGHGTGTNIGDPIEISALTKAYQIYTDKKQFCGIGSVKTNIGHLVTAGGITSLIKTVLSLQNKQIPASLNFERPNPKIDFLNSPFYVNDKLSDWPKKEYPRRAGVSSFGIGGTNVHIILEEAPQTLTNSASKNSHHILLSSKTDASLKRMKENLFNYLCDHPTVNLADVSNTLANGRTSFEYRFAAVCHNVEELKQQLSGQLPANVIECHQKPQNRPVCLVFSTMNEQLKKISTTLYETENTFKTAFDECANLIFTEHNIDVKEYIFVNDSISNQFVTVQLSKFTIHYALVSLFNGFGIKFESFIDDGLSEFVMANIAGVFSLDDTLKLIDLQTKIIGNSENRVEIEGEQLDSLKSLLSEISLHKPITPFISSVTGTWISDEEALSKDHWLSLLTNQNKTEDSVTELLQDENRLYIEIGSDIRFSALIDIPDESLKVLLGSTNIESDLLLSPLVKLWSLGLKIDWREIYGDEFVRRIPLPTYSFDHQKYWIETNKEYSPRQQVDISLTNTDDLKNKIAKNDDFSRGSIGIELGFSEDLLQQQLQIDAVLELKKEMESICATLSNQLNLKLEISDLGLNKRNGNGNENELSQVALNEGIVEDNKVERPDIGTDFIKPTTEWQQKISVEWCDALGFNSIGINDNFFELGGHSLMAAVLTKKIKSKFNIEIEMHELLQNPTILDFSELVKTRNKIKEHAVDEKTNESHGDTLLL